MAYNEPFQLRSVREDELISDFFESFCADKSVHD